ncbi:Peroxisomal leader peptide-processing protease, partial [Gryllus bimaculatus]
AAAPGAGPAEAEAGLAVRVWWHGRAREARLLYRTPPGRAFDVAVLQLDDAHAHDAHDAPRGLRIAATPARRGERVLAAGFALFSEQDARAGDGAGVRPLLAAGEIARARPALLQTTCVAQSGASGGAVLRPTGELLALLVCNVRDALSGALYPHFSMAAPAAALRPALLRYAATRDVRVLQELESCDPCVQRLWELQVPAASCKL